MNEQEKALRWLILHCGPDFEFGPTNGGAIYVRSKDFHVGITVNGDIVGSINFEVFKRYFERREAGLPTEAVQPFDITAAEPTVDDSP